MRCYSPDVLSTLAGDVSADFSSDFEMEGVEEDVDAMGFRDIFCMRVCPPLILV